MYDLTQPLFWYRPLFVFQLLVAELFFASGLKKRSWFAVRIVAAFAAAIGFAFAFPMIPEVTFTAWYSSMMFLCLFAASIAALCFAYGSSFKEVLFCAIAGYTVQHIAQETYEMLNVLLDLNGKLSSDMYGSISTGGGMAWFAMLIYGGIYIILYALACMLFASPDHLRDLLVKDSYLIVVSLIIILVDVLISSVVTYMVPDGADLLPVVIAHLYNIICCIVVLLLLFELPKRMRAENELEVVRRIHHREKEQYFAAKENIDLINMKCHDLKHQIRMMGDKESGKAAVAEIENIISVYDLGFKTENEALDVILTEKSLLCHKLHIKLSCIADGAKLNFMKDTDIYALFGNLLDNAIEAVEKFAEDKRMIGLSVRCRNSFLMINARNTYDGELSFSGGLPVTSKRDKEFHGFGLKSIRYVVDKYRGEMKINADKHIFNLNIVFPL